jgi:hypothetical protein
VPPGTPAVKRQAQNVAIKLLCGLQVANIETGFKDLAGVHRLILYDALSVDEENESPRCTRRDGK